MESITIGDTLDTLLLSLAESVNTAILEGDFEVHSATEFEVIIRCCGELVSVWNTNLPENTYCYKLSSGLHELRFPYHTFINPAMCRDILRERGNAHIVDDLEKRITVLQQEKEGLS